MALAAVFPLTDAGDSFLYARELVDGEKLQTFLRLNGPLIKALALTVVNQIAGSLESAFTKGLLHRNICDETVRLCVDDDTVNVNLVDLGLPVFVVQGARHWFLTVRSSKQVPYRSTVPCAATGGPS